MKIKLFITLLLFLLSNIDNVEGLAIKQEVGKSPTLTKPVSKPMGKAAGKVPAKPSAKPGKSKLDLSKIDVEKLSEKELDELLKDPSMADIKEQTMGSDIKMNPKAELKKPKGKESKYSEKYKEHMESLDKEGLSIDDPLKEEDVSSSVDPSMPPHCRPPIRHHLPLGHPHEEGQVPLREPFPPKPESNISFMNEKNLQYLIEVFKQPIFFNMLPAEAKNILESTKKDPGFLKLENSQLNASIEKSLRNSQSSQVFVDPDGVLSRKGMLTIIDPINASSQFVWTVANSKVLCFYRSQSFMTIIKLYRNSELSLRDISATPCFLISSSRESDSKLVCTISVEEKEIWLQTLKDNLSTYN